MKQHFESRDIREFIPIEPPPVDLGGRSFRPAEAGVSWWYNASNSAVIEKFNAHWNQLSAVTARKRATFGKGWMETSKSDAGKCYAQSYSTDEQLRNEALEQFIRREKDPEFIRRLERHRRNEHNSVPNQFNLVHWLCLVAFQDMTSKHQRLPTVQEWKTQLDLRRMEVPSLARMEHDEWSHERNRARRAVGLQGLPVQIP